MTTDEIYGRMRASFAARSGMEPEERSVIDRCLPVVYRKYFEDPRPENMPKIRRRGDLPWVDGAAFGKIAWPG